MSTYKEDTLDRTRTTAAMEDHAQRIRDEPIHVYSAGDVWITTDRQPRPLRRDPARLSRQASTGRSAVWSHEVLASPPNELRSQTYISYDHG